MAKKYVLQERGEGVAKPLNVYVSDRCLAALSTPRAGAGWEIVLGLENVPEPEIVNGVGGLVGNVIARMVEQGGDGRDLMQRMGSKAIEVAQRSGGPTTFGGGDGRTPGGLIIP